MFLRFSSRLIDFSCPKEIENANDHLARPLLHPIHKGGVHVVITRPDGWGQSTSGVKLWSECMGKVLTIFEDDIYIYTYVCVKIKKNIIIHTYHIVSWWCLFHVCCELTIKQLVLQQHSSYGSAGYVPLLAALNQVEAWTTWWLALCEITGKYPLVN